ncbi:MAG: galactose mutarotase [Acidimicrobiia bacterium]|nr:galactose mutarotase [Acidimicrobiia bacterium]
MTVQRTSFGAAAGGHDVGLYACENRNGLSMELISLGATVKSVVVPDRDGEFSDVTLGFPTLDGYLQRHPYFGSTVGRFANRIAGARFEIEGTVYRLAANDGPNHLHGGEVGFDRVPWEAEPFENPGESGVRFRYLSRDLDERYPGNLQVEAVYALNDDDELRMSYAATTDAPTPVNLTNHTYWNLAGGGTILEHEVAIEADRYLPVDDQGIPTGEIAPVVGTPLDFTEAKPLGRDLDAVPGLGYDHSFVLRHRSTMAPAARLVHPQSGRVMEIVTSQPGLQLYSGNKLSGFEPHGGFGRFAGVCLETQHFPDSPNQPEFPTTTLAPGEQYAQMTVHRFSVEN